MDTSPRTAPARLRVEAIDYTPGADGTGSVEVRLSHARGEWSGRARGLATREGHMRMGADAALAAVRRATDERLDPALGGIKAIRAFDTWLVVVSVEVAIGDRSHRLLGAQPAEGTNMVQGAVHAVLDALNRVVQPHLLPQPTPPGRGGPHLAP